MSGFGFQNQTLSLTPTGYIDSAHLNGADNSDQFVGWAANLTTLSAALGALAVGTAVSVDLTPYILIPAVAPTTVEFGYAAVTGDAPLLSGFTVTGTGTSVDPYLLSNACALPRAGSFRLVVITNGIISSLSSLVSFVITNINATVPDTVAPSTPTTIVAVAGTADNTIALSFDAPCDLAPPNSTPAGSAHVDVLVNGVAAPPSPIVVSSNPLAAPTNNNVGNITSPAVPVLSQANKMWTFSTAGTGLEATTSEQIQFADFGLFSGVAQLVAQVDGFAGGVPAGALAGIIVHETGIAGGRLCALALTPAGSLKVITRTTAGAATTTPVTLTKDGNGHVFSGPVYLKVVRSADNKTITLSYSLDENGTTPVSVQTVTMAASVHLGIFATSASAGTLITTSIEEVAITTANRSYAVTVPATAAVSLQLRAVDANNNASDPSPALAAVPKFPTAPSGGAIVWKPGVRLRIGGYASMDSYANIKAACDAMFALDINHVIKGISISPTWAQLEGPTLGQYDNFGAESGFTKIGKLIALLKSYSPPRDLTVLLNCAGNGWQAQSTTNFLSNFCPSYMNSSTYGGGEAHITPAGVAATPRIIYWNANVVERMIALFSAYYTRFGPDTSTGGIYRWDPIQEISNIEGLGGYSAPALLAVWPRMMAGLRTACPQSLIFIKPTFINPNNGSSYKTILAEALKNFISMGQEDTSDASLDWGATAYLGNWPGQTVVNHTTAAGGNPDWDFHCNVDPAELFHDRDGTKCLLAGADSGSGRLYDYSADTPTSHPGIWTRVNSMKASHVDIFANAYCGPNVNRTTPGPSGVPPNPAPGPGAGLTSGRPNLIDVLTGNTSFAGVVAPTAPGQGTAMAWTTYPVGYPK